MKDLISIFIAFALIMISTFTIIIMFSINKMSEEAIKLQERIDNVEIGTVVHQFDPCKYVEHPEVNDSIVCVCHLYGGKAFLYFDTDTNIKTYTCEMENYAK